MELGGKSPCIVDERPIFPWRQADRREISHAGQTCVAPDYVYVHASVKDAFLEEVKKQICAQYGPAPLKDASYGRIVSRKHFDRVSSLIETEKVIYGGGRDETTLKIEPTVLDGVTWADKAMQEEIFGPVMPVLTFESLETVIGEVNSRPSPLALYIFSSDKKAADFVMNKCRFGGGCINDTIIHLATSEMAFGGFGASGMGSYHGKAGFDCFSHEKSIVDKKTFIDLPMRYRPYKKSNEKLLRFFLK
ncbi:MAG: aldehyde dehydrogenase family protein [Christensenellaceae bacterium]